MTEPAKPMPRAPRHGPQPHRPGFQKPQDFQKFRGRVFRAPVAHAKITAPLTASVPIPVPPIRPALATNRAKPAPRPAMRPDVSHPPVLKTPTLPARAAILPGKPASNQQIRITILGGNEEVGRNMAVFEYGQDIVIVDMGLQWPEEDMPGIDYIVPNVSCLKGKEKNIRGVIFTHGHLDHIGAAPILLKQLGYPPVIGRDFTLALIKKKTEDYEPGTVSRLKMMRIKNLSDVLHLGQFTVKFFEVEHSIMDAIGIILATPAGSVIHMGDWTITNDPIDPTPVTYTHLATLPRPTTLMLESLGALKKGLPPSEREVHENFKNLLKNAPGRVIIGTFASQIRRIGYILEFAEQLGKKVALEGYSMKTNVEVAKELGYLKTKKETLIPINEISQHPDNRVVVICTGAQGETKAALSRIVNDMHRFIKIQKTDTIVFSSSTIPGNERSIQRLKDNLYRKCDNIIHSDIMEIHISGHSTALGIEEMLRQVKPDYFIPVYANYAFLKESAKIAYRMGFPQKNVFVMDDGHVLELGRQKAALLPKKVDTSCVFVDGLGVGDVSQIVLRDRQVLAEDGMVVVIVQVDQRTGELVGSPDIVSRGFIFMKEHRELIEATRAKIRTVLVDKNPDSSADGSEIRNKIRDEIGGFLFQKTERRPMILPVIIEV